MIPELITQIADYFVYLIPLVITGLIGFWLGRIYENIQSIEGVEEKGEN